MSLRSLSMRVIPACGGRWMKATSGKTKHGGARRRAWAGRPALAAAVTALMVACGGLPAEANWLGEIFERAGASSGSASGSEPRDREQGAAQVRSLPLLPKGSAALAAHVTPEGHWRFANRAGEAFTAGTPEELRRAVGVLAPELAADGRVLLYLSEDSVFVWRQHLKDLPKGAELSVVVGSEAYKLVRRGSGEAERLYAEVRPNLIVELSERKLFDETLWQLSRPLERSAIRVLALEPGGPHTLAPRPKIDGSSKRAAVDAIDPYKLAGALSALEGQTALLIGRVEDEFLHFRAGATERPLLLKDLTAAAEAGDVNLLILQSGAPRQPGGRNWLWLKLEVAGLEDALRRASLADFLNVLGAGGGQLAVASKAAGAGRIRLDAAPSGGVASKLTGPVSAWVKDKLGGVTGDISASAIQAHLRSAERQREIDRRLIPFLPSLLQYGYLAALIAGVLGIPIAWRWWSRIWPPEQRGEYRGAFGYHAARLVKTLAFLLLFLPVTGPFAFVWGAISWAGRYATAPFRRGRDAAGKRGSPAAG